MKKLNYEGTFVSLTLKVEEIKVCSVLRFYLYKVGYLAILFIFGKLE